jgi:DNA-binding IclR family transcriptional regulator
LPQDRVEQVLRSDGLVRFTPFTLTRVSDLKKNLREIRERGYALDNQELERGLNGVAAPVLAPDARIVAAVGIAGPTSRFRGNELAQKISLAKETATRISGALGGLIGDTHSAT